MLNFKTQKIASIISAIAIMTVCNATAFAATDGLSLAATDAMPDFSSLQEGSELTAIGAIDPESVAGVTTGTPSDEAGLASVVDAGIDLSDIDFSTLYEGELTVIGAIDPSSVTGGTTTEAR